MSCGLLDCSKCSLWLNRSRVGSVSAPSGPRNSRPNCGCVLGPNAVTFDCTSGCALSVLPVRSAWQDVQVESTAAERAGFPRCSTWHDVQLADEVPLRN